MSVTDTPKLPRAAIFGCAGKTLSDREAAFFAETDPLGFILFARNVDTPAQVTALTASLRRAVGREDAPVLVDQEGGRVQRLGPPTWQARPAQNLFARMAAEDVSQAIEAASLNALLIGHELIRLGIDVDCLPVMDVPVKGANAIIGDRSYGDDPETVAELGKAVVAGLISSGVVPIIKHIPGHGRALVDSHLELPWVDAGVEALKRTDFLPFRAASQAPWAMTAHVVYEAFDPMRPATLSEIVIGEVIRGEIGFQGFLVSDDMTMKALRGDLGDLSAAAIDAGCDAVLHCSGDFDEMTKVAAAVSEMSTIAWQRFQSGRAVLPAEAPIDAVVLQAQLDEMIADWL